MAGHSGWREPVWEGLLCLPRVFGGGGWAEPAPTAASTRTLKQECRFISMVHRPYPSVLRLGFKCPIVLYPGEAGGLESPTHQLEPSGPPGPLDRSQSGSLKWQVIALTLDSPHCPCLGGF